jgi:hypothetical protein
MFDKVGDTVEARRFVRDAGAAPDARGDGANRRDSFADYA